MVSFLFHPVKNITTSSERVMPISLTSLGLRALEELAADLDVPTKGTKNEFFSALQTAFLVHYYETADASTISRGKLALRQHVALQCLLLVILTLQLSQSYYMLSKNGKENA